MSGCVRDGDGDDNLLNVKLYLNDIKSKSDTKL